MNKLNQLIDKYAKFGEPLMFFIIGILLLLSIGSSIEPVRLGLRPYIIPVGIVLAVLATIGFTLNNRKINQDSAKRKSDFDAMVARHDAMLKPFKKK